MAEHTYDYAIVRVVPRVERGERVNVGVILSCVDEAYLACRLDDDLSAVLALDPGADLDAVRSALAVITRVCAGGPEAGEIGALPPRARFRWLASPRSTIVQPSRVHTGRTTDPAGVLDRLYEQLVARGRPTT